MAAKGDLRLTLAPLDPTLPPRVRVSAKAETAPAGHRCRCASFVAGPARAAAADGAARNARFRPRRLVSRASARSGGRSGTSRWLSRREPSGLDSRSRPARTGTFASGLPGPSGAIATALATGDQNAVSEEDAEAMRRSGLAHLLSVSGLHIAAVVGAAMFLTLKLLALSERLALRFNLVLVAAGVGRARRHRLYLADRSAGADGAELHRGAAGAWRNCAGPRRDQPRLVAVGALVVLLFRPEALAGASFQLSFAAVTAIIALAFVGLGAAHAHAAGRRAGRAGRSRCFWRWSLTGLAVEIALMPFALYHFHKAGLYGVAANLVAIPLTTFVIMPLEAGALCSTSSELGAPLWWAGGHGDRCRCFGSPTWSPARAERWRCSPRCRAGRFALMVGGGLVAVPVDHAAAAVRRSSRLRSGAAAAALSPTPDLLVTGDGRHLAVVAPDGMPMMLRDRSGDFMRDLMSEASGFDEEPGLLAAAPFGSCSRDTCVAVDPARTAGSGRLLPRDSTQRSTGSRWSRPAPTPTSSFPTAGFREAARRAGSSSTARRWSRPAASPSILTDGRGSKPSPSRLGRASLGD